MTTTRVNLTVDETRQLEDKLAAALKAKLPVDVVSGAEAERRLPPDGLAEGCVADASCRFDVAKRLDADELLLIVAVRIGERTQLDATWSNPSSEQVVSRDAIVITADQDVDQVMAEHAPGLLPHLQPQKPVKPDIVVVRQPPDRGTVVQPRGRHFTIPTWIATGAAAGSLIGATVFSLRAQNKFDDLEKKGCKQVALCTQEEIEAVDRDALIADVLWGTTLASGVTALVFYLRSGEGEPTRPTTTVGVRVDHDAIGLSFGGAF